MYDERHFIEFKNELNGILKDNLIDTLWFQWNTT